MEWAEFSLALGAFLASHVIPARCRAPLIARIGRGGYVMGYSLLSLLLLCWLVVAAGRAPFVELWPQAIWMRWLVNLAMPIAFMVAMTAGMAGVMGAFALWAGTHLMANGDLAHASLFGLLLAYALFGLSVALRRPLRVAARWPRCVAAALIWAAALSLHPLVIGVNPLP
ncbi:NnrU family protein [Paracoccus sp. MBLB3053]|uniref:NnrU family protein n=1 Tax=Paracoccus aurantius TaxID=3073814 RepID=A0ABU2HPP8_9RHOB|nr:NnrU family protein [Paracoccus sp. MBLB3053]MDS9467021.1 NnrU family protein [Paracoccus sp. MBLB3053]